MTADGMRRRRVCDACKRRFTTYEKVGAPPLKVQKRDPGNVSATIGLGGYHVTVVAMVLVADPEPHHVRAEALLARALEKAPNASMVHFYHGVLHKTRGRPEAALLGVGFQNCEQAAVEGQPYVLQQEP